MIERTPGTCGGRARIAGTRIAVWIIIMATRRGASEKEMLEMWPHLTAANLKEAQEYYSFHKEEIDRDISDQKATEKK